ncbi:MAG: GumC family protein, partial [Polyangiales bacterium]
MSIADETVAGDGTRSAGTARAGVPVDPYRLRRALRGGLRLLVGAAVGGLVLGFLWAKLGMSSGYETTAVLKYEGALRVADMPVGQDAIGPVADALKRQSVLRKIADETGFDGTLTTLEHTIGYDIDMMAGTIHIHVGGETGEDAAEVARIVTGIFIDYHRERQAKRIEAEYARIVKRIEAGESEVELARRQYNEFREEHGIADLSTEQRTMVQSAAELRAQSELAVSDIRALEAQVASLDSLLASTPKTSAIGGRVSPERAAYERLREELVNARSTLSPDHPRVQSLQQQVAQLGAELRRGGGASPGGGLVGVNSTYQVVDGQLRDARARLAALRERQKGLSQMAAKAQTRVETFSDIEGEASALLAEVKVDENLLSGLRRTEAALEDALRDPPSGLMVLDPGAVPEYPVRNKMKTVVFLAVPMITVGLALLFILRREFGGLRLQTPAEFGFWGRGPVLASTTWPADPLALDELVAGLDDFAPRAKGSLLIIGGTADESRLASQLAQRMNNDWFRTGQSTPAETGDDAAPSPAVPLQTPAPSGPYPLSRTGGQSVALARRSSPKVQPIRLATAAERMHLEAWDGPFEGQALRRAARLADRVVVVVPSDRMSVL